MRETTMKLSSPSLQYKMNLSNVLSLVFLISLPLCGAMAVNMPKQILIYGGNGFIGSSTAEKLLASNHSLTLVNRGNWYWDSHFKVKPFVRHIKCDRLQPADKCTELQDYVSSVSKIDIVIDFSAYHPEVVSSTLHTLNGKCNLYIYISTDSVYEVCDKNGTEPSKETDAVRPVSKEKREQLASQESYGHRKLQCEELLVKARTSKYGPRFVSLRLPDVFGPRDNTYRWWIYQMWIKMQPYLDKEVVVPSSLIGQPVSLVYVEDVADLIVKLAETEDISDEVIDNAFNLAQKETPTLKEVLEEIRDELNVTDVQIGVSDKSDTIRLFPSVYLGPVDTSKAEQLLNWKPTDWKTAMRETVKFYESAISTVHFDRPRRDIIRTMQTYFTQKPYNVIRALRDVYFLNYPEPRDEL